MLYLKSLKIEPLNIEGLTKDQNMAIQQRLEQMLMLWKGTPYLSGQGRRGRGVDCVHFIVAIYDMLLGTDHTFTKLPQDASFHNKAQAEASLRMFFRMYPCSPVKGDTVQPGDIVICGPVGKNGGPGHGMIVGSDSLWHVDSRSVCKAGLAVMQKGAFAFKQIRRLKDRVGILNSMRCVSG